MAILRGAWYAEDILTANAEAVNRLREQSTKITTVYSQAPAGGGPSDKLSDLVSQMLDLQDETEREMRRYTEKVKAAKGLIKLLDDGTGANDRLILLLTWRYIDRAPWVTVASRCHYSWNGVFRAHRKALYLLVDKRGY